MLQNRGSEAETTFLNGLCEQIREVFHSFSYLSAIDDPGQLKVKGPPTQGWTFSFKLFCLPSRCVISVHLGALWVTGQYICKHVIQADICSSLMAMLGGQIRGQARGQGREILHQQIIFKIQLLDLIKSFITDCGWLVLWFERACSFEMFSSLIFRYSGSDFLAET